MESEQQIQRAVAEHLRQRGVPLPTAGIGDAKAAIFSESNNGRIT